MLTVYGIKNCDTVKRARSWLNARQLDHQFHDFRKDGIDARTLEIWLSAVGANVLVNRQSRTWRALGDDIRHQVDEVSPIPILLTHPALMRGPILVDGDRILVGFKESEYLEFLNIS